MNTWMIMSVNRYIMDKFPWMLPSFYGLEPRQRAPILFTQGNMGFNNGWMVQGEARAAWKLRSRAKQEAHVYTYTYTYMCV